MWACEQSTRTLKDAPDTAVTTGYSGSPADKNDLSKQAFLMLGRSVWASTPICWSASVSPDLCASVERG